MITTKAMRRVPGRLAGMAMHVTLVTLVVFVAGTAVMVTSAVETSNEQHARGKSIKRRLLADAGISESIRSLAMRGNGRINKKKFEAGDYAVDATDNGDGTWTLIANGLIDGESRTLVAVAREVPAGPFQHGMFAGNSSGDPTYVMRLGGTGTQADAINGAVYSGGDISVVEDARVTGVLRATGTVSGAAGENGYSMPIPDIAGANYAVNHDVNVALEFDTHGVLSSTSEGTYGGSAIEVPEDNRAHFFRKNATDRVTENLSTVKDDYYLEDPYETPSYENTINDALASPISLAGMNGEPGVSGNQLVYYVDGNIWIHNLNIMSFVLASQAADGVKVTFVAKGNIYLSDNILIKNEQKDGIAFIAINDVDVPDSGNIYFGDNVFGTIEMLEAFMYAENDFHDTTLGTSGSDVVTLNGLMSAGNHVAIERDNDDGTHTKLELNFDNRIATGSLLMPGLPTFTSTSLRKLEVLSLFETGSN